uniref:Secreted protein n=1 Tax=Anopheles quadriannulatus TaxID=34691 RepID=A0A182XQL8_ANOQN
MQLAVMRPYQHVLIFLLVLNLTLHCDASCSFGLGDRVPGERLLHTITITKGPYELDQMIEMNLDYRVSPLQNEEITFIQLDGTADGGCSALISNSVDRRKATARNSSKCPSGKRFRPHGGHPRYCENKRTVSSN